MSKRPSFTEHEGDELKKPKAVPSLGILLLPRLLSDAEVESFERFCAQQALHCMPATHYRKSGDASADPRRSSVAWLAPPPPAQPKENACSSAQAAVVLDAPSAEGRETSCPPWLFARLVSAARRGAEQWPDLLPGWGGLQHARGGDGNGNGNAEVCAAAAATSEVVFEHVQYAEYGVGEHYQEWHLDGKPSELRDGDDEENRALAVVVLLRPALLGGAFEALDGAGHTARRAQQRMTGPLLARVGDAVVFPAQRLWHRVAPVLAGKRSSLVFWAGRRSEAETAASSERAQEKRAGNISSDGDDDDADDADEPGLFLPVGSGGEDSDDEWRELERKFLEGDKTLSDDFEDEIV